VSFANPPTEDEKYDSDDYYVDEPPPGMLDPKEVSDEDIKVVNVYYNEFIRQFGVSLNNYIRNI
jgi:hypothetical protein